MAVKKTNTKKVTKEDVNIDVDIPTKEDDIESEVDVENELEEEQEDKSVNIENEINDKEKSNKVEVDTSAVKIDDKKKPKGNVKIRMRESHKCTIAMVKYDLKKGQTYNVPENVKRILDKSGLLAPLN